MGDYSPAVITRFKSRGSYSAVAILKIFIFALIFAALHEVVNLVCLRFFFSGDFFVQLNALKYSLFNMLTITLYYARIGVGLLLTHLVVKRKVAPFLIAAIYIFEGLVLCGLADQLDIWMPFRDATVIFELMEGSMDSAGLLMVFARGIVMDTIIAIIAWLGFQKKDVFQNEKK